MKTPFGRLFSIAVVLGLLVGTVFATNITFQVNLAFQARLGNFSPATDSVFVRGSFQATPWSGYTNKLLDLNGDSIYSNTFDLTPGPIEFKYVLVHNGGDVWESRDNRMDTVTTTPDSLPVVWFNDQAPALTENVEINFRVNMTVQQLTHNFDPATDWIVVRGNNDSLGQWGGAQRLTEETGNPGVFSRWIHFPNAPIGTAIEYKYVILTAGDPAQAHWESNDNRTATPTGNEPDNLPPPNGNGFHEIQPAMVYFSNVGPQDIITRDLNVIFEIDIRPLLGKIRDVGYVTDQQAVQDTVRVVTSIQAAGFFNNFPWGNFPQGDFLNDLGQNGDAVAGDSIWSGTILMPAGSARHMIYKFGANQYDVEAGFAHNHEIDLDDSQASWRMPVMCWGLGTNPADTLYAPWEHLCITNSVGDKPVISPTTYRLDQNYPNPFNPTTTITFALPRSETAQLRVYDLTGREVTTLVSGKLEAGEHTYAFDGSKLATGVYFYQLKAGSFTATRKLLLLK